MPQQVHEQLRRIPTGTGSLQQRLFGLLYAGLQANQVFHVAREALIQLHQEIDGGARLAPDPRQILRDERSDGRLDEKRRQLALLGRFILERELLRIRFEEEVEGIQNGHFRDQIDFDAQLAAPAWGTRVAPDNSTAGPAAS